MRGKKRAYTTGASWEGICNKALSSQETLLISVLIRDFREVAQFFLFPKKQLPASCFSVYPKHQGRTLHHELFEIENLNFTYPLSEQKALHHISFHIEDGEFVVICGEIGKRKKHAAPAPQAFAYARMAKRGNDHIPRM
jgi:ABC-type multidrug transport system fused ATPase/permease subunit